MATIIIGVRERPYKNQCEMRCLDRFYVGNIFVNCLSHAGLANAVKKHRNGAKLELYLRLTRGKTGVCSSWSDFGRG